MKNLDDYQLEARDFLLPRRFAGLFDAPGVGKTGPAIIAGYEKWKETGRGILVTAPAYLLQNWANEIEAFVPGASVSIANGTGRARRTEALEAEATFILTSYNNWSAGRPGDWHYPVLNERHWGALIFDEAHRLRGRNALASRHVRELPRRRSANADTSIWCLTGTPVVNNPGDLFPLLQLWNAHEYKGYWKFVKQWCDITETPWSTDVGNLKHGLGDDFQALLRRFSLRRELLDVPSLCGLEELHSEYHVELPVSVRKTIAKAKKEYRIEHPDLGKTEFVSGGGALYPRLRQMATNPPTQQKPKIEFVLDFLQDHPKPVVVYVWYRDSAKAVAEGLTKSKRPVTVLTGDVPSGNRQELADQWSQTANGVLVATISALKEGISLVAATDVLFLEHSELPSDQEQCVGRLKRRGQTSTVHVHHVYAKATPDIAIRRAVYLRETSLKSALTSWICED